MDKVKVHQPVTVNYEVVETVAVPPTEVLRKQIEMMKHELSELERQEEADRKVRVKAFEKKYKFTFGPLPDAQKSWDKLYDPTLIWMELKGEFTNYAEYKATGGHIFGDNPKGSMKYLYNILTKKIVMRYGGGNVYISDSDTAEGYAQIEALVESVGHYVEVDITDIVVNLPNFYGRKKYAFD